MSNKKRIIIISIMAVLLIVTGYLNIKLNNSVIQTNTDLETSGNFFSTYRVDRTLTRDQELLYLDAIISSETASNESKLLAEDKKMKLIQTMEQELVLEGLIKAKGFNDVIVTNSTNNINVIVKSNELVSTEVAQIVSIITEQTGKPIDNIKILPIAE